MITACECFFSPGDVLPERRFEGGVPEVGVHLRPDPDERQRLLARPPVVPARPGRSRAAGDEVGGLHIVVLEAGRGTGAGDGAGADRWQFLEISTRPRRLQLMHRRRGGRDGRDRDRHGGPRRRRRERGRGRARAIRRRGHVRGPGASATVVVQHGHHHHLCFPAGPKHEIPLIYHLPRPRE